jgi:hypothetical protein
VSSFPLPIPTYKLLTVDDVITVNEAGEIQRRFPRALVIGSDGSREMLAYDFRQGQSPLLLLDITAQDWSRHSTKRLR